MDTGIGDDVEDATRRSEVADSVAQLVQGSILQIAGLPFLATLDAPLHPAARFQRARRMAQGEAVARGAMVSYSLIPTSYCALISQTCDLQRRRTLEGRDLVQVAAVVVLEGDELEDALSLTKPQYVPLPWLGEQHFIDLDHVSSVDRGLVASLDVIASPSEANRRKLSYLLGRYFSRTALPDDVVKALSKLRGRAETARHPSMRRLFDEAVEQIRVRPDLEYDVNTKSHLTIYFILDEYWYPDAVPEPYGRDLGKKPESYSDAIVELFDAAEDADSGKLKQLWRGLLDVLHAQLNDRLSRNPQWPISGFSLVPVTSLRIDEYEESDALDIGYLSLAGDTNEELVSGNEPV